MRGANRLCQLATDDPLEERVTTVGRIHPHAEGKVVGPDGAILPVGQQGEYCSRGYAVMLGYWEDPERTAEAIDADGWMHSGDLATMDERGYVRITGRIKDMIIRGGENIYPREIEELLVTLPGVVEAAVVGMPHAEWGEVPVAYLVCEGELDAHGMTLQCRQQLASFKVPRQFHRVEMLPRNAMGKLQKHLLK